MKETIKCACPDCGAKYRLPVEAQGRSAKCKKCGAKFAVPAMKERSLEDTVLDWLTEPSVTDEEIEQPRVATISKEAGESSKKRGVIRMREDQGKSEPAKTK